MPSRTRRSARSRPKSATGLPLASKPGGGLNFTTSAGRLTPFDSSTESCGRGRGRQDGEDYECEDQAPIHRLVTLTREAAGAQSGRPEYNARMPPSRTDANLQVALAGEADANRRYLAYGIRALAEGRADIAQLFFEAAGAETIHALEHLRAIGAVRSTRENLLTAATGEMQEIDVTLPRMIREADEDGRPDAAASFRLALERERHHRDMFRHALATFDGAPSAMAPTPIAAPASAAGSTPTSAPAAASAPAVARRAPRP